MKSKVKGKFQPGKHYSPETQFQKGGKAHNRLPVGTIRVRTQKDDGKRQWIKVKEPDSWTLLAKYIWIQNNGPIPKGKVIHHKDDDKMNDVIENLACLTRKEHFDEHNIGEMGRLANHLKTIKI